MSDLKFPIYPIYLDTLSTTPVAPEVLAKMLPYFTEKFGNPSSQTHSFGWDADAAVEFARSQVAALLGASESEVIFTSGATEANNIALQGVAQANRGKGSHLITTVIEHSSVSDVFKKLESQGFEVTWIEVEPDGRILPEKIERAIRPETTLVSVIAASNETGVIQPILEIGKICLKRKVIFHTDASQMVGKLPFSFTLSSIDLVSLSGHKIYGPKGGGALLVRKGTPKIKINSIFEGGGHENGLRPGTLNVPAIVGLGAACELAGQMMESETKRVQALRNRLWEKLSDNVISIIRNGHQDFVLPHVLSVSFCAVDASALMLSLREVALSSGSACSSGDPRPSPVLKAMGLSDELIRGTIRFGLSRSTTIEEIDFTVIKIQEMVKKLRLLTVESQDLERHGDETEFDNQFRLDPNGNLTLGTNSIIHMKSSDGKNNQGVRYD